MGAKKFCNIITKNNSPKERHFNQTKYKPAKAFFSGDLPSSAVFLCSIESTKSLQKKAVKFLVVQNLQTISSMPSSLTIGINNV